MLEAAQAKDDQVAQKQDIERLDSAPLAERARTAILSAIISGEFEERLPPEDELAAILGVSRTTVRAALQSLEENGVVTRRRAVGTTINKHVIPSRLALGRLVGFDRMVEERGGKVVVDFEWEVVEEPPQIFRESFDLPAVEDFFEAGGQMMATEKSFIGNDTQAIHASDLIPMNRITKEPVGKLPPSLFEFSRQYMDVPIDHAIAEIAPMVVREKSTTRLALNKGEPFVRLHQRSYTSTGELISLSITDANDRSVRYEIFRR